MTVSKGKLIAFSGIDGAGKSTQINKLLVTLASNGHKPIYLWTRGGYTGPLNTMKTIARKILGNKALSAGRTEARNKAFQKGWVQTVWLTLAMLDLVLVYGLYIRLLTLFGRTVVADRYLWDTWIDFTLNFPEADASSWSLWHFLEWIVPQPDHAFLFLVPVEESLRRSRLKNEPFPDSEAVLHQRLERYQQLSRKLDWQVIDCTRPVEDVAKEIHAAVMSAGRGRR